MWFGLTRSCTLMTQRYESNDNEPQRQIVCRNYLISKTPLYVCLFVVDVFSLLFLGAHNFWVKTTLSKRYWHMALLLSHDLLYFVAVNALELFGYPRNKLI